MPILAGGDGWGMVGATSCSGHTQLMVSGQGNLAVTIAPSVFAFASFNGCTAQSVESVTQMSASLPWYKALLCSLSSVDLRQ